MSAFKPNQLVWAKVVGFPWWPGIVAMASKENFTINFIGEESHAFLTPDKMRPFINGKEKFAKNKDSKRLKSAIDLANKMITSKNVFVEQSDSINSVISEIQNEQTSKIKNNSLHTSSKKIKKDPGLCSQQNLKNEKNRSPHIESLKSTSCSETIESNNGSTTCKEKEEEKIIKIFEKAPSKKTKTINSLIEEISYLLLIKSGTRYDIESRLDQILFLLETSCELDKKMERLKEIKILFKPLRKRFKDINLERFFVLSNDVFREFNENFIRKKLKGRTYSDTNKDKNARYNEELEKSINQKFRNIFTQEYGLSNEETEIITSKILKFTFHSFECYNDEFYKKLFDIMNDKNSMEKLLDLKKLIDLEEIE